MGKASGFDPGPSPFLGRQRVLSASVRINYLIPFALLFVFGCGGTTMELPVPSEPTTDVVPGSSSSVPASPQTDTDASPEVTSTVVASSEGSDTSTTTIPVDAVTTTVAPAPTPATTAPSTTLPEIDYDEPTPGFESEEPNNNDQFITYEPNT